MTNKTLQSNKVDLLSTQLINFRQRRITNAADAINQQDYVTKAQLDALQVTSVNVQSNSSVSSFQYVTFIFPYLAIGVQTTNLRIQFPAAMRPTALDVDAVGTPGGSGASFDLQTSPDQTIWTSILTTPCILPAGSFHISTLTTFAVGATLTPGNWIRAIVTIGSDLLASQVGLQLKVK